AAHGIVPAMVSPERRRQVGHGKNGRDHEETSTACMQRTKKARIRKILYDIVLELAELGKQYF
ncbi:MAG: hypothetical protein ABWY02_02605, partial [Telluria sp.]